jgi:hypothetical protein
MIKLVDGKTTVLWMVLTLLGSLAVGGTSLYRLLAQSVNKKPVPYTVTLQQVSYGLNGTVTPRGTLTWAVRSDGSRLIESASPEQVQRTIDFATKDRVIVIEQTVKKSTTPNAFMDSRDGIRDSGSECLSSITGKLVSPGESAMGHELISGYRTVRITNGEWTAWYSLDYGCAMIRSRIAPQGKPVLEKTLVSLISGEPSADLFDVSHFQEVPPSGLKAQCAHCDPTTRAHNEAAMSRLDAEYFSHRQ